MVLYTPVNEKSTHPTRTREFINGVKAELPILVGVFPFGLIYGVSAINAGISPIAAIAMSLIVLAGSAQFVMVKLIGAGVPPLVTIATGFIVNLRHVLYSASIAPHLKHLNPLWKWVLAYTLTDEAYAVAITRYHQHDAPTNKHWYLLGTQVALWSTWQLSTALGILLGAQFPESWSLDFTIALTFIALVVPMINNIAGVAGAATACVVAILAVGMPYKLDLIVATFAGIIVAMGVDHLHHTPTHTPGEPHP